MLSPVLQLDAVELPTRIRLASAVVPVLIAVVAFVADPVPWVAMAAVVAISPYVLLIARVPLPVWVCTALPLVGTAWLMSDWVHNDLSLMLLVYLVGQQGALLRTRWAVTTWLLAMAVPLGWQVGDGYDRWPAWLIGMTFACACGLIFRKQQETMHRLELAQQELADKAVTDERRRIAREVHDLVAHSLAVTMLHLTGARLALADGETAEAEAALAEAERLGRSSMTGIRQAVGLLTDSGDAVNWAPEPDVDDVPALVEDYRRAGADVRLTSTGVPTTLEPAVGLAAYRLVQESLANSARHAPGQPVTVELTWTDAGLEVTVANPVADDTVAGPAGHGLAGMRERAEQLGGHFVAGPSGAMWRVHALLAPAVDAGAAAR